jgi:TonB-dependent receptor
MDNFVGSFRNNNYYDGSYKFGPAADWDKIVAYYNTNQSTFSTDEAATHLNSDASNYNLNERITAGYLMNTLEMGKLHLQTGVRFEATHLSTTGYHVTNDANGNYVSTTPVNQTGSYLDALPMIQARIALNKEAAIRAVYGRGLARPNPQDVIPYVSEDQSTNPYTYSLGNPNLKAEHANNYDLLYEQYLNPLGLIQAGFFYKDISDPIVTLTSNPTTGSYAGYKVSQPANAGSAYVTGIEIAFQQHLSYLPGMLSGLGFSGNYSYTASKAHHVMQGRSDSPALLRQAPNTWNISPTYDRGIFSVRLGIAYNGPNIYAYQWTDGADSVGIKGPSGDNYLYAHTQIDAQGTLRLTHGFTLVVSGLNLNNEVFGFYNGSPQYVVQREYYKPTYSAGLRWTPSRER